ncbi:hypothetical protein BJ994_002890 [Arthrobacter pigmenti]|uniref:SLH domain-containing protein n=1 Tax=Arthrobacter pigmenti TaxID=271432 RepID=A0A846RTI3_9MICC|nr:S-layer homology domain-containing protein [Arthrobacter pigmenti]NJC23814.1 hypothetical protein [Arthrobacter pigmenti]
MALLQRSTATLTGVLLLAGSLTVGVSQASAETAETPPALTHEHDHGGMSQLQIESESALGLPDNLKLSDHTFEGTIPSDSGQRGASPQGSAMSPLGAGGTLSRRGNIDVTLVTVDLADSGAQVPYDTAKRAVDHANGYWKSMSNGRITMSVGSKVINHKSAARSTWSYSDIMNKVTAELRWSYSPYKALVVFIPSGLQGGILGYGWSSNGTSGRILMPQITNFTTNVMAHEFGHVLGLMHADSLECTNGASDTPVFGYGCGIRAYGDTSDLMGLSRWFDTPAISSSFWDYGGFGRGDEILNAGIAAGRKTYTLRPWAGTAANRAVKFTDPRSRETYYLELRTPVGFDTNLAVGGNRGVKIVQNGGATSASSIALMPSTRPYPGYYASNTAWQAGQVFTTHAGTTVTINSVANDRAVVTIDAGLPFKDLRVSTLRNEIEWLAANKLTNGWPDGTYRPLSTMTREQMAAFLYRMANPGVKVAPKPRTAPFRDVPANHVFAGEIAWMKNMDVANGWSDGYFRPTSPIMRDQMAAFLHRYAAQVCAVPAAANYRPGASSFVDVNSSTFFSREISWMATADVSHGWVVGGRAEYRPLAPITREQMAAFISRLDGYLDRNGGC